jgi:predicted regulator of Ras-like GTPase activity (Roadblock/LC7/MglB family)
METTQVGEVTEEIMAAEMAGATGAATRTYLKIDKWVTRA